MNKITITSEYEFENLCCDIAKEKYGDYDAQKYGRRGQKQWGVDIIAKDRKNKNEDVVIQCKFKMEPILFSGKGANRNRKIIKHEVEAELASALEKHTFDRFIYASNIANDTKLKDFAEELSKTYNKDIILWNNESIDKDIIFFPRLTRLYTELGIKAGVELIDQDFIDDLVFNKPNVDPNIFRFYAGSNNKNEQWYGILRKWDATRDCMESVNVCIDDLFAKGYISSKVAALVFGEGGCGKSTLLRRIAINNVLNKKPYVNWWIEDIDTFLTHEIYSIDSTQKQKHLLFIEDWYRNVGARNRDKAQRLFQWLKNQSNVLVVIGDREGTGLYSDHLYGDNKFELKRSENNKLLSYIADVLPELNVIVREVLSKENLIQQTPLFVILYVISETYEQKEQTGNFDLEDIKNKFRKIIAKKLFDLENDERYKGLGRALFLCADIYADESLSYFTFSKESFVKAAQILGENNNLPERIESNENFPDQVNSFVYTRTIKAKSGKQFNFINFNHDLLAEQGIKYAEEAGYELKLKSDTYENEGLMDALHKSGDLNTALMIWLWLYNKDRENRNKERYILKLEKILKKDLTLIKGSLWVYIIKFLPHDIKIRHAEFIINRRDFFKLPHDIVSTALNILGSAVEGKKAAKIILSQPDFFSLPFGTVSTALSLLGSEDEGKTAAQTILKQKDFYSLPYQIVSAALNILRSEDEGKTAAKTILSQPGSLRMPKEIVSTALNIMGSAEEGKTAAKAILNQQDFFKMPKEIVSTALSLLESEDESKKAAKTILNQPDFFKMPKEIVSTALSLLESEDESKKAAKTILNQPDFFKLPPDIVCTALNLLRNSDEGKTAAKTILNQQDFFKKVPYQIVSTALNILGSDDEDVKKAAKTILERGLNEIHPFLFFNATKQLALSTQDQDRKLVGSFLSSLSSAYELKKRITISKKIFRLYHDILFLPLMEYDAHRNRVFGIIKNYRTDLPRKGKYNIYKVLKCYNDYPQINYFRAELEVLCKDILQNWQTDIQFQLEHHPDDLITAHIKQSLIHLGTQELAREKAKEIIDFADREENVRFTMHDFYKTAKEIYSKQEDNK